jgi:Tfp pilus assembly protein PilF
MRSVDWQGAPFAKLNALPKDGKAVTSWSDEDEAFAEVARGIRGVVEELRSRPLSPGPDRSQRLPAIWNVPYLRNPHFVGRDALLDELHGKLTDGRIALTAMHGMGGVGKTQLALEYAYRQATDFDLVWWLRANNPATLLEGYAALAGPLGVAPPDESELAALAEAVCRELVRRDRWLLVFDAASEPSELEVLLPKGGGGRVLITSRNPGWPFASALEVPVLSRGDTVRFLLARTKQNDEAAARALADQLGDLPLAVEQAAAYMVETGLTLATYLELFRTRRSELWHEEKPPVGYPETVGTTWTMAVDRLRAAEPRAVDLLSLCAFLAPEAIPRRLLAEHDGALPSDLGEAVADPLRLNRLVGALRRYSLVEVTGEGLNLHRLVQAATRDALTGATTRRWVEAAVAMMNAAFPYVEDDPSTWAPSGELLAHALAAAGHGETAGPDLPGLPRLLNEAASFLETRAEFDRARTTYQRALKLAEETLGPCDPKVATYANNLGHALRAQGDLPGARACFEQALAIDEASFGPEHPTVASDVNNLGRVLRAQGDLAGARASYERALKIFESHLGADHPDVATIVNNQGAVLQDLGDLTGARACYERALAIDEAAFGPEHPNVAIRVNNLGTVLQDQADLAGARAAFERALHLFEKFLASEHPNITNARNHLQAVAEKEFGRAKD